MIRPLGTGRNSWQKPLAQRKASGYYGKTWSAVVVDRKPQETSMDFFFFFLGVASVGAALYYLKKNNPNKQHHH
jgi:hypothetical protein